MKFEIGQFAQQGDVVIKKVSAVKGKKLDHLTLAVGEATGHCHNVTSGKAELYEHEGTLFLKIKSDNAILTHQEHKPITIKKGHYQIWIVREYDYLNEETRKVAD